MKPRSLPRGDWFRVGLRLQKSGWFCNGRFDVDVAVASKGVIHKGADECGHLGEGWNQGNSTPHSEAPAPKLPQKRHIPVVVLRLSAPQFAARS